MRILYEDEDVVVVDKPTGVIVHPWTGKRVPFTCPPPEDIVYAV